MKYRRFGLIVITTLVFLMLAAPSFAYEEDTHFLITYVVCRASGFTHPEALLVASVDQGMDDSRGTVADGGYDGLPKIEQEWLWHAFDKAGKMGPRGIINRKEYLFKTALTRKSDKEKLIYLGMFFHYQQDTWAHRHYYKGNPFSNDTFTTYETPIGHVLDGHQPDRPPYDPICAFMCLEESFRKARIFIKQALRREPNPFFAGYHSLKVSTDDSWPDKRRGNYFHMLRTAAGTKAQEFLLSLIREQVNSYTSSLDKNPRFFLRHTANKANFETVRISLQRICAVLKDNITIPTRQDKLNQGFTTLTSARFAAAIPK